ncbi:response regulator [Parapedobacter sp. 2B3]|uniref:response regulator transcription factor n=1 Tax=Parapedobacter sp. 2B3 TaxID=3342381 RepID=UPI0035B61B0F
MNEEQTKIRLAIVDDRSVSVDNLRRAVSDKQDVVLSFTATNGIDLQEQMDIHGAPDVILLDVEMPLKDGYKTAQWLRQYYPDVRIIAISIFAEPAVVSGMIRSGAHGFLPKGSPSSMVYSAIKEVVERGVLRNAYADGEPSVAPANPDGGMRPETLTVRQIELMHLCDSDDTFEVIADKMCLSVHTVKRYASEMYHLFGVHSRPALLREARRLGLLPLDK